VNGALLVRRAAAVRALSMHVFHAPGLIERGAMRRAMFLGNGSLCLGQMTNLADAMSVILEVPVR